jgi:hypothetical protein
MQEVALLTHEYLTVEFDLLKKPPLIFRFADNSVMKANHLQEFLNRQSARGWQLLAALPLTYVSFTVGEDAGLHLHCCRLIFLGPVWTNSDSPDTEPPPDGSGPSPRLKPA